MWLIHELLAGKFVINMKPTILVYGWYNQGNVGDELFKDTFTNFFPNYNFIFVSRIEKYYLADISFVFIGGGSFLFAPINMQDGVFKLLKKKSIFYIGVGPETEIHAQHLELMKLAKLVAVRSSVNLDKIKSINSNTLVIPDIVYSLQPLIKKTETKPNSVLVLPNTAVVPSWQEPHWKHAAWNYFKSEFSQFLDVLIDSGYTVNFAAMCQNKKNNDLYAAIEIINSMKNKSTNLLLNDSFEGIDGVNNTIAKYSAVVTQRFHGIVLSEMSQVPFLCIYHHDKMKPVGANKSYISYYNLSKDQLLSNFYEIQRKTLEVPDNNFDSFRKTIINIIVEGK